MKRLFLKSVLTAVVTTCLGASAVAGDLLAKANAGDTVRIGFANEVPWAYPDFANSALEEMITH